MKAIIQHNWTSGLGDVFNCICEYVDTCNNLRKIGYTDFDLIINSRKSHYIPIGLFWDFFNKSEFEKLFNSVKVVDTPIEEFEYGNCEYVYTFRVDRPAWHWWDLFLQDKSDTEEWRDCIRTYNYIRPDSKVVIRNYINPKIVESYNKLKFTKGLDKYNSIYFRAIDHRDSVEIYPVIEKSITDIIDNSEKVYCCSNSFEFKKYIKELNNTVITYEIPGESVNASPSEPAKSSVGNHYGCSQFKDDIELSVERTKFGFYEMLTLADSERIDCFSLYRWRSNFLFLGEMEGTELNMISVQDMLKDFPDIEKKVYG